MKKISKLLLAVGGVGMTVVTTIVVMNYINGRHGPPASKAQAPPPLAVIKAGETRTSKEIEVAGFSTPEKAKVDTGRLQATYQVGKTYTNLVKAGLTSKGSYKDWGISTDLTFNYLAEFQFSRFIVANDGNEMTVELKVDRATTVSVFTSVDSISIEMGPMFETALEAGGTWAGLPLGSTSMGKEALGKMLNAKWSREYVGKVAGDEMAKAFAFVDSLQGKRARIVVGNGKGVVSITPVNCVLTSDDQLFLDNISLYSDIAMMQKLDCKPGDTWTVQGNDLIPILDPSMKANIGGSVTIRRGEDLGGTTAPQARLTIAGGVLTMQERYAQSAGSKVKQKGSWAPKGDLIFDFAHNIVTEAELTGSIELVEESTDHILFQMKNVIRPAYTVTYTAWLNEGNQLDLKTAPPPPTKLGTLDALRNRFGK